MRNKLEIIVEEYREKYDTWTPTEGVLSELFEELEQLIEEFKTKASRPFSFKNLDILKDPKQMELFIKETSKEENEQRH